jgi:hypothetical protein
LRGLRHQIVFPAWINLRFPWNPGQLLSLPQADATPAAVESFCHKESDMSRNPDGTFKTGDAETRESARKGGEASGGSRQHGQRHAKPGQQSQSEPDQGKPNPAAVGGDRIRQPGGDMINRK